MRKTTRLIKRLQQRDGVILVSAALVLIAMIAFAAMAVDIGYAMVVRNELQDICDASALAAARYMGHTYEGLTHQQILSHVFNKDTEIFPIADQVAQKNMAGAQYINLNSSDVEIGQWDATTRTFTANLNPADAVRVKARRDGSANGPISTYFARVLGINTLDVSAVATAALTGQSTTGPGGLPVPFGIPRYRFQSSFCNQPIIFYPANDPDGCAGWHFYDETQHGADRLRQILDGLAAGTYISPETIAGITQFYFTGGNVANALTNFQNLFDVMKVLDDGILDQDNDPTTWTTALPVYDWGDCSNPNTWVTIVGFATITIHTVTRPPEPQVIGATIICMNVDPGRGSGGEYGTYGSIPGLVE